jgi:AraC-like DNA-binding protein
MVLPIEAPPAPGRDLDPDALSSVAAYSKYHFLRQFTATFGLSVHRYIQLACMKRAPDDHRRASCGTYEPA